MSAKKTPGSEAICGATTVSGRLCKKRPGQGTDHPGVGRCKIHGGNTPAGKKAAGVVIGTELIPKHPLMGVPIKLDPAEALIHCVAIAAGEVEYCSMKIAELDDDSAFERPTSSKTEKGFNAIGEVEMKTVERGQKVLNQWVRMRHQAMDRLARYSKMALDAGVAERQITLAENQALMVATALKTILDGLGLSADQQRRAPELMRSALMTLETPGELLVEV